MLCMIAFCQSGLLKRDDDDDEFGASAFNTVVRWHKLGGVNIECILHNFIVMAICVPKIWWRFDEVLLEFRCQGLWLRDCYF